MEPDHSLVDGNWDFVERGTTTTIIKGDQRSLSIAAASIIAKVTRDRVMRSSADEYPWYAFDSNKGYPCHRHRAALRLLGPSTIHRRSWSFMSGIPWEGIEGCHPDEPTLSDNRPERPDINESRDARMQPIRILIADDHSLLRAGLRSLLANLDGFEVVGEADSGETGLPCGIPLSGVVCRLPS